MGNRSVTAERIPGLGRLESAIMLVLWNAREPLKCAEVIKRLDYDRKPAYTTVASVLAILCDKSLVRRLNDGRAWRYRYVVGLEHYLAEKINDLIRWANDPASVVIAAMDMPEDA